jgi:hypothetical protein
MHQLPKWTVSTITTTINMHRLCTRDVLIRPWSCHMYSMCSRNSEQHHRFHHLHSMSSWYQTAHPRLYLMRGLCCRYVHLVPWSCPVLGLRGRNSGSRTGSHSV